jgi:citrate lyase subunit beta/citryl-CoA lyase
MICDWRSLLFVPANDAKKIGSASRRGADAIILDLEDAVPPDAKDGARSSVRAAAASLSGDGLPVVVRINAPWLDAVADLQACMVPGVSAIMVPKADDPARIVVLGDMISEHGGKLDLVPPALIALIESPLGVTRAGDIAATGNVVGLAFGPEDYAIQAGLSPTPEALNLPYGLLRLAASAQGIRMFGLPTSIADIADVDAWHAAIRRAAALGGDGALCIHPSQIEAANLGFSPTREQIAQARRVVEAWHGGGVIALDGKMIDLPVYLRAAHVLSRERAKEVEASGRRKRRLGGSAQ